MTSCRSAVEFSHTMRRQGAGRLFIIVPVPSPSALGIFRVFSAGFLAWQSCAPDRGFVDAGHGVPRLRITQSALPRWMAAKSRSAGGAPRHPRALSCGISANSAAQRPAVRARGLEIKCVDVLEWPFRGVGIARTLVCRASSRIQITASNGKGWVMSLPCAPSLAVPDDVANRLGLIMARPPRLILPQAVSGRSSLPPTAARDRQPFLSAVKNRGGMDFQVGCAARLAGSSSRIKARKSAASHRRSRLKL